MKTKATMKTLLTMLLMTLCFTTAEAKTPGKGKVYDIVEKNGSISNVKVVRSVHPLLDAEAMRVVNSMPKWTPGKRDGKPVRVKFNIPVQFKLK